MNWLPGGSQQQADGIFQHIEENIDGGRVESAEMSDVAA